MIIKSKPVEVIHLRMCRVFVSANGHPLDKTVRDANLFCWFRHLERVSFFVPAESEDSVTKSTEEIDIPLYQKAIALSAVVLIAVIIFIVGGAIFGHSTPQQASDRAIQNCGGSRTSFDTDCPEPDYDKDLYDEVNQYPDDSY